MSTPRYMILFLIAMTVVAGIAYLDISTTLNTYTERSVETITTLQDVLNAVHEQDAALYRVLTSDEENQSTTLQQTKVLNDLFSLQRYALLSPERISSRVDDLTQLQRLRAEIIAQHNTNLISSQTRGEERLESLLKRYERTRQAVLTRINEDISLLRDQQLALEEQLRWKFLFSLCLLLTLYGLSLGWLYRSGKQQQAQQEMRKVLSGEHQELLTFIRNCATHQQYPTFKDVKAKFHYTHPTLVKRIRELEHEGYVEIRQQGRNKHLLPR